MCCHSYFIEKLISPFPKHAPISVCETQVWTTPLKFCRKDLNDLEKLKTLSSDPDFKITTSKKTTIKKKKREKYRKSRKYAEKAPKKREKKRNWNKSIALRRRVHLHCRRNKRETQGGKKQTNKKNNTLEKDAYKVNCIKIWLKYIFNKFWETLDFKRKF